MNGWTAALWALLAVNAMFWAFSLWRELREILPLLEQRHRFECGWVLSVVTAMKGVFWTVLIVCGVRLLEGIL